LTLRQRLRASPIGPALSFARERSEPTRGGLAILGAEIAGRLPSHKLRRVLARAMGMTIGPRTHLYRWREVRAPANISIGDGTVIGFWATLDGREGIEIGRNVNFSSEVALWTLQHDPQSPDFGVRGGPIVIEDDAWVSFRATVLPGVRIGRGAVVAAGAVVTQDVPSYAIVGGIPARVIGQRTDDLRYDLGAGPGLAIV
jgi:acetyltransferase-like isoleucine patch superfamily enzyme